MINILTTRNKTALGIQEADVFFSDPAILRCVAAYSYGRLINSAEVPTQSFPP